ncbi:hypothetical protein HDV00_003481 [Rhizophlyctis rosea]|nr:hypothetical protein HDV00_003481 [Rhizophlyctis rosea]
MWKDDVPLPLIKKFWDEAQILQSKEQVLANMYHMLGLDYEPNGQEAEYFWMTTRSFQYRTATLEDGTQLLLKLFSEHAFEDQALEYTIDTTATDSEIGLALVTSPADAIIAPGELRDFCVPSWFLPPVLPLSYYAEERMHIMCEVIHLEIPDQIKKDFRAEREESGHVGETSWQGRESGFVSFRFIEDMEGPGEIAASQKLNKELWKRVGVDV